MMCRISWEVRGEQVQIDALTQELDKLRSELAEIPQALDYDVVLRGVCARLVLIRLMYLLVGYDLLKD